MHDSSSAHIVVDHLPARRRSLRVAVVTETYPPEVNGVALTLARVVQGLSDIDHDVQLIRPRQPSEGGVADATDEASLQQVLMRGLPIPRYPNLRMGMPARRYLKALWSHQRPDVVHIATEGPLGWSALQAASQLHLPISSDFRTNFHSYSKHYGVGWLQRPIMAYLRKFHNRTHCTMVPTEALRADLQRHGFHSLQVVSRGVDLSQFDPAHRSPALRQSWGAGHEDTVLLCVGRLASEKNLETLIEAYQRIRAQRAGTRLVLVGDGPLRGALQQQCPDAVFAGQRSGLDLAAHYASADLFMFPSVTETFGNVTVEAMASGLPVLAFDYAAAAELIREGVEGRLVKLGDNAAFVRAALALAADPRAQWQCYGAAARQRALSLDWRQIVAQFESVLCGVISHAQGGVASPTRVRMA
ncbi:glycosyltransferase family 4 protein [Roseateles sp.]|jgi:glycosyltransferase involved in cell wall biosynthesis|uniref:glycosyltransferase family 4 protein n=1 Tax=Roseateles sp. TaxID=1971397 RepID=UPI0037C82371